MQFKRRCGLNQFCPLERHRKILIIGIYFIISKFRSTMAAACVVSVVSIAQSTSPPRLRKLLIDSQAQLVSAFDC